MKYVRQKYEDVKIEDVPHHNFDCVQLKYDGIWCCMVVKSTATTHNHAIYYSRTGQKKGERLVLLPPGVYIGEFMFGSEWAQSVFRKDKIYLFDVINYEGEDLREFSYRQRYCILRRAVMKTQAQQQDDLINITSNFAIQQANALWVQQCLSGNYEGLVFRNTSDVWDDTVYRAKPDFYVDGYAVAFYPGQGKHAGRLGAIGVAAIPSGPEIMRVGGGFSDAQRNDIWTNQDSYRNNCLTVVGKKLFRSGALRHPNFIRWHLEK